MKNFIITIGALLYMITIIYFQIDLNEAVRYKQILKYAADEGAATASLFIEEQAYGNGKFVYNDTEAVKKAREIIKYNLCDNNIKFDISFTDDNEKTRRYNEDGELVSIESNISSDQQKPIVFIKLKGKNFNFRLPFLSSYKDITVKSHYEYVPY